MTAPKLAVLLCVCAVAGSATTACDTTSDGRPTAAPASTSISYPCGFLRVEDLITLTGATSGQRTADGAICVWQLDGPYGTTDVDFAWFETGTLDRERSTDSSLGYAVTDTSVAYHHAITVQQKDNRDACGVEAESDPGVVEWWVEFRSAGPHPDPCAQAHALATKTFDKEP